MWMWSFYFFHVLLLIYRNATDFWFLCCIDYVTLLYTVIRFDIFLFEYIQSCHLQIAIIYFFLSYLDLTCLIVLGRTSSVSIFLLFLIWEERFQFFSFEYDVICGFVTYYLYYGWSHVFLDLSYWRILSWKNGVFCQMLFP